MNEAGKSSGDAHGPVQGLPGDAAADALERLGRSLGWRVARIDLAGCRDKPALLGRAAAALGFPGWFGHNWDAFYDCLVDLGWRPGPGHLLVFEHTGELQRSSPEAFETAAAIMGEAAADWELRGVPFRAFLLD